MAGGGTKDSEEANSMMFDGGRADPDHRQDTTAKWAEAWTTVCTYVHHCLDIIWRCTGHHVTRLRARRGSSRAWRDAPRRSERAMDHAEPITPGRARSSWPKAPVLAARLCCCCCCSAACIEKNSYCVVWRHRSIGRRRDELHPTPGLSGCVGQAQLT